MSFLSSFCSSHISRLSTNEFSLDSFYLAFLFLIFFSSQLFFQNKTITEEEAFVLFVRKNALQVLIPKYGLEGTVFMDKHGSGFVFNEEVFDSSVLGTKR